MKYIFELYWFGQGGGNRHNLTANDYQTEPQGGWGNWTARHNVNYMLNMIQAKESFTLLGDANNLIGQAQNAGTGNTRCVVGAEVLLLLSAGYIPCIFNDMMRRGEKLIIFLAPQQVQAPDNALVQDAINYLDQKPAAQFWTNQRKNQYINLIRQTYLN